MKVREVGKKRTDVVLLEGGLRLRVGDVASNELAKLRHAVLLGAAGENGLRLVLLRVITGPGLKDGVLQGAGVGEGHVPGVGRLVHGVEVQGGVKLRETAREEHNTSSGGGNARLKHAEGGVSDLLRSVALRAISAGANHGRLEQHALKGDVVVSKVLESLRPHPRRDLEGGVDVVFTVEENLGLDDRNETSVLANGSVTGKTVSAVSHSDARGAVRDGNHRAPLAEAGSLLIVGSRAVREVVKALAPRLVGVCEGAKTLYQEDSH